MAEYTLFPSQSEDLDIDPATSDTFDDGPELCGAEMSDGRICDRPAEMCPYEAHKD